MIKTQVGLGHFFKNWKQSKVITTGDVLGCWAGKRGMEPKPPFKKAPQHLAGGAWMEKGRTPIENGKIKLTNKPQKKKLQTVMALAKG